MTHLEQMPADGRAPPSGLLAVCMIGAIGSGKTWIAGRLAAREGLAHLSPDFHYRPNSLAGISAMDERHQRIEAWSHCMAAQYTCIKSGRSLLIDTASRGRIARVEMTSVLRAWIAGTPGCRYDIIGIWVRASLEKCLLRNRERAYEQPSEAVESYWQALQEEPPAVEDGFDRLVVIENDVDDLQLRMPCL